MKYSITQQNITCVHDGKSYTVPETSPNYRPLRAALVAADFELAVSYLDVKSTIKNWKSSNGLFTLVDGNIQFKGENVHDVIAQRVLALIKENEPADSLLNFYERLSKNPSARSVEQLYKFLEHYNIPLTPDGCFLAYKGVTEGYMDCRTNTIDNRPGTTHEMPRNKISDDPNEACHFGFHVGALDYAVNFGRRTVVCKVDPEHVVCVPYDHSAMKMRVCKYAVVADYVAPLKDTVDRTTAAVTPSKVDVKTLKLDELRKYCVHELGMTGTYNMNKAQILDAVYKHLNA